MPDVDLPVEFFRHNTMMNRRLEDAWGVFPAAGGQPRTRARLAGGHDPDAAGGGAPRDGRLGLLLRERPHGRGLSTLEVLARSSIRSTGRPSNSQFGHAVRKLV